MKYLKFLLTGVLFGIILSKAEIISWYRIYEMFQFDSFHMYGVIGSAIIVGMMITLFINKNKSKDIAGNVIQLSDKSFSVVRYLIGGTIFGLGWAMTGACPGPIFILLGKGIYSILIVLIGGLVGTFLYGYFKNKLPH